MVPLGYDTITIVHRSDGPPDDLGVATVTETQTVVTGCSVQPLSTEEELSDVDRVVTRWRLFAPPDTVLTATDAVLVAGVLYEVDGDPQVWTWAGTPHHLVCLLRRATG